MSPASKSGSPQPSHTARRFAVEQLEPRLMLAVAPMTVPEQHMHELINWVRAHPVEAAAEYNTGLNDGLPAGTISADPKPPLARNDVLRDAMEDHVEDMLAQNYFDHTSLDGTTWVQRIVSAGYNYNRAAENIAWSGTTGPLGDLRAVAEELVKTWFESSGHRKNLMDPALREVGSSFAVGPFTHEGTTYNAGMGGQDFGARTTFQFLTGVGCHEFRTDHAICDVTQPLSGATVTATRQSDNLKQETTTGDTGEYDLWLPNGTWNVHITGGGLLAPLDFKDIVVAGQNVKLDFIPGVPKSWHNVDMPMDVNKDTHVTPNDVLVTVNELNARGHRELPYVSSPPKYYYDTNADNHLSPGDVLLVVNFLNGTGSGEGESLQTDDPALIAHGASSFASGARELATTRDIVAGEPVSIATGGSATAQDRMANRLPRTAGEDDVSVQHIAALDIYLAHLACDWWADLLADLPRSGP